MRAVYAPVHHLRLVNRVYLRPASSTGTATAAIVSACLSKKDTFSPLHTLSSPYTSPPQHSCIAISPGASVVPHREARE